MQAGHCRINGQRTEKAAAQVGDGDVLTFRQGSAIRVIRVIDIGDRRGPATEAQTLYIDLTPRPDPAASPGPVPVAGGRPTGKDRRTFALSRRPPLE